MTALRSASQYCARQARSHLCGDCQTDWKLSLSHGSITVMTKARNDSKATMVGRRAFSKPRCFPRRGRLAPHGRLLRVECMEDRRLLSLASPATLPGDALLGPDDSFMLSKTADTLPPTVINLI